MPRLPLLAKWRSNLESRRSDRNMRRHAIRRSLLAGIENLESRQLLAADVLLMESFEGGGSSNDWGGAWVEDSQDDWFRSTQRSSDGSRSAEVDGRATGASLSLSQPVDLSGYESAELTFDWFIEYGFDNGEYLALELFDGSGWQQVRRIDGTSGWWPGPDEHYWHSETVAIDNSYLNSDFNLRFVANVSSSSEDGFVDNVRVSGIAPDLPTLSISDTAAVEGDDAVFVVELSAASDTPVTVAYSTLDVSADEGADYVDSSGTLTFAPGTTIQTITVPVLDDTSIESTEIFSVVLSNPVGATISDENGEGAIADDDAITTINYPDFTDSAGLTLLGDAGIANGDTLRLTPAAGGTEGAAWHSEKQFVAVDWETSFDFNLNENVGDFGGSDGFTFVIQNHAPTYLSGGGGTLGYAALPNSLVIEFDTFQNVHSDPELSDSGPSEISVHTAGSGPNFSNEDYSIGRYTTPDLIDDAETHHVRITYVDQNLSIYLDDLVSPVLEIPVNLSDLLELDGGKAWLGFTSATGGGYQNHDILNWNYTLLADVSSTVAIGSASALEGNFGTTDLVFEVVREGDLSQFATLDWFTTSGTASNGTDYTDVSGQISFAPGDTSKLIVVPVVGDETEEGHETLSVHLENLSSGFLVVDHAIGTILNDDTSLSIADSSITEGDSTLKILSTFVGENSGGLTRPRLLDFGPDANGDGVQDLYVASADTDEILRYDGVTGAYIDAFITGEPQLDNPLGFAFSPIDGDFYVVSGGSILRFDGITGSLIDEPVTGLDGAAGITFFESGVNVGDLLIAERNTDRILRYDGSSLTEFVTAGSGGVDLPRNAAIGPDGDLYVSSRNTRQVLKYSGDNGQFLGVVAEIPLESLAWIEFGQDGLLYATGADSELCCNKTLLQIDAADGTILQALSTARDGWSFTVGPGNLIYNSGNGFGNFVDLIGPASNATIAVSLSTPSAVPVTVDFSTNGLTAIAGSDYSSVSGTLTFEPGIMTRTIVVPTIDDNIVEPTESFRVSLSNVTGATFINSDATVEIIDNEVPNAPPVVDAGADQTVTEGNFVTLVGSASDSDGMIESVEWSDGVAVLSTSDTLTTTLPIGTHVLTFSATDNSGATSSDSVVVTVEAAAAGPNLSHGELNSVSSVWQTVTLSKSYTSPVIVTTPRYNVGSGPGVVRIHNVTASSFDVRIDNVGSTAFSGGLHYVVVEEGVYDEPGFKLEAVKYSESQTSRRSGWQIDTSQGYQQSYSNPVVVGQVMSTNDSDWSVFWASSNSRTSPPSSSQLNVGKHVAEDPDTTRATETIGYLVIEATQTGTIEGLPFVAGVGSDIVRGVGNGTNQYGYAAMPNAKTAILSSAGMDGNDGGWAVLRGSEPLPPSGGTIALSIDEDQLRDSERNHTTEQVAYFVIDPPVVAAESEQMGAPAIAMRPLDVAGTSRFDVNGDGVTSPIDALQVINRLNTIAENLEEGDLALDINGDESVTPLDALLVINRLNASHNRGAFGWVESDEDSVQASDDSALSHLSVDAYFEDFATGSRDQKGLSS